MPLHHNPSQARSLSSTSGTNCQVHAGEANPMSPPQCMAGHVAPDAPLHQPCNAPQSLIMGCSHGSQDGTAAVMGAAQHSRAARPMHMHVTCSHAMPLIAAATTTGTRLLCDRDSRAIATDAENGGQQRAKGGCRSDHERLVVAPQKSGNEERSSDASGNSKPHQGGMRESVSWWAKKV